MTTAESRVADDAASPTARLAVPRLTGRRAAMLFGDEGGAATAEYAITTMAIVARLGQT